MVYFDHPLDFFYRSSRGDARIGADPVPEYGDSAMALIYNQLVNASLKSLACFWSYMHFPAYSFKPKPVFAFVACIPFGDNIFGNLLLGMHIGR